MPEPRTYYTPQWEVLHHGIRTCAHCGQLRRAHYTDARCYTPDELLARLQQYQKTGVMPAADWPEGTTPETTGEG
jgi:hypothetical protein